MCIIGSLSYSLSLPFIELCTCNMSKPQVNTTWRLTKSKLNIEERTGDVRHETFSVAHGLACARAVAKHDGQSLVGYCWNKHCLRTRTRVLLGVRLHPHIQLRLVRLVHVNIKMSQHWNIEE